MQTMRASTAFLLLLLLVACGPKPPPRAADIEGPGYPTVLTPPSELGADFAMQQQVTMRHARGENSFSAVLQKQGDTLTLLALGPHGGRAFSLVQRGQEVEFESYVDIELPFPPEYILHDVHRTWFARTQQAEADGERIDETRDDQGRLLERCFERLDERPAGRLCVRYAGGLDANAPQQVSPPDEVVLDNGWFGYTATVRTSNWQRIE